MEGEKELDVPSGHCEESEQEGEDGNDPRWAKDLRNEGTGDLKDDVGCVEGGKKEVVLIRGGIHAEVLRIMADEYKERVLDTGVILTFSKPASLALPVPLDQSEYEG
jgi:hypothetical protein